MRLNTLRVIALRAYQDTGVLRLGDINVIVGANNSGKSSILRAVHSLQDGNGLTTRDIRIGETMLTVVADVVDFVPPGRHITPEAGAVSCQLGSDITRQSGSWARHFEGNSISHFPPREPFHAVVPFYSQRKSTSYAEQTGIEQTEAVSGSFSNLAAKLSRLMNPSYPGHQQYDNLCKSVLGKSVFVVPSRNGQVPGRYVAGDVIDIASMGDGVPHIVGLLADLINSTGKIFLIEEPENDLHPQALKALLDVIQEKSKTNQFFITTHSNIVVRHLGSSESSRLFRVRVDRDSESPTAPSKSVIEPVPDTTDARIDLLRELGYTLADFELREGWLILEESSAGHILTDFLIPLFAPRVARLSVVSAGGVEKVRPTFDDFMRLVLYSHLQKAYKDKTWVLVDGDVGGRRAVEQLRQSYPTWPEGRFQAFEHEQFERYYPRAFSDAVNKTLSIGDRQEKREAKRALLKEVSAWLREDLGRAKQALEESAADVIHRLRAIEAELN